MTPNTDGQTGHYALKQVTSAPKQPNILLIMDDQHRFDYLGCMGSEFVDTPNLDRIAQRGVLFRTCCTNSPLCAPARIGLAAGLQPSRMGALDNECFLPRSVTTYYQRLRDAGYRVGCVGKLDLAKPDKYNGRYGDRPCIYGWGFTHPEECEGKMHAARSATPLGPYGHMLQENGLFERFRDDYLRRARNGFIKDADQDSVLDSQTFEDGYIGERAVAWLRDIPDDLPWHFFVSFVGPHDPFDPPNEYAERYRQATMPAAIQDDMEGKPDWVRGRAWDMDEEEIAVSRQQYCAEIALIDHYVGQMLDVLEARGQLDDTYILFSSDHGEMLGDHGLYTKWVPYEASLRVPLIVSGPGIKGGRASDALVELIDVNPTICELAGLPPQENIDALSLGPVLRGESETHRDDVVSALRNFRCMRTEKWKFVENYNDMPELYDMENDPQELHNVAGEHSDLVRQFIRRLQRRYDEGGWRR